MALALCPQIKLTIHRTFYQYNPERKIPIVFADGYFSFFLICTLLSANRYARQNEVLIELFEENNHFEINLSFNMINKIKFSYIPLIEKISSELNLNFAYNYDFNKFTVKVTPFYTDIGLIGLKAPAI